VALFDVYVEQAGPVEISVYDVTGRITAVVQSGELPTGSSSFAWTVPDEMGNGLYFVRAQTAGRTSVSRLTLLR
jgi:hypothetical protein